MKRLALLGMLFSLCIKAHAQTDSIRVWNKWCARKDTAVLFTTANNTIAIYSATLKPAELKLKSLDNSLRIGAPEVKGDTTFIMAMPYPGKGKKMRLAVLNKKTGKALKTIEFASDNVPPSLHGWVQ